MANVRQDNVQIKLEIDGSQSRTELDNLTRKAKLLQEDLKGLKKGTQEYVDKNKEISQVTSRMGELQKEIGLTSLSTAQLQAMSRQLNRELAQLTPNTQSFADKAKQLTEVDARLAQVRLEAKGVKDQLEESGNGFGSFVKKSAAFAGIQLGIESVVSGLKQLGSESIDAAAKGSDSIADMEKSLNVTTEGARALRGQLEGIDTRTAQEDLEGIAIAGGQLGVAAADVDEFTVAVDQAVVALGDEFTGGVDDVTKSIGGLQKLFKDTADLKPDQAITKIGSALNALGADGSATAPVIAEFAARVGQLGDLAPEISQTLGLGAAFQELGLSAEISSGGLTNVLLTASKDTAGFAKQLGLTQQQFVELLNSDPNEVILKLAESLKGASNTQIVATLDKLGIKSQEATKVVSLLANQTDIVRQKQALAAVEMEKGTSLTEEFTKKNTNSAAEIAKAEKGFAQYRRELGEQLIPIYIKFLQYGGLVLNVLRAAPAFVSENRVAFGLLALAVLALNAAQIKSQVSTIRTLALQKLQLLGLVTEEGGTYTLVAAKSLLTRAQMGLNAAMTANPIAFVLTLVALLAFGLKQLYDRSETFRAAVDSLFTTLRPLGALFGSIAAQIGPLLTQIGRFFGGIGGGKAILELFGVVMAVSVVLPLKLLIANVQLSVDALVGFLDVGKRVANFFGADFKLDPNGSFDALSKNIKRNAASIKDTLTGQDGAKATGGGDTGAAERAAAEKREQERVAREKKAAADKLEREKKAAAALSAALLEEGDKQHVQQLKLREIQLQRQLAAAKEGSEQELKLKKQLVLVGRDIELADGKKTGDERVLIQAKTQLELDKLNADFRKSQSEKARKQAEKDAEAAANILKRQAELEKDEYKKKADALRAAAAAESVKLKGSDAQVAEQRRLIQAQLQQDLLKLEAERVEKQRDIARRIEEIDSDIALRRIQRQRDHSAEYSQERAQADADELTERKKQLDARYADELFQAGLTEEQKLAISRKYLQDKDDLDEEFSQRSRGRAQATADLAFGLAGQTVQALADFSKIGTDKELAKLDKDKKVRLAKLDAEYKAGAVSKEQYEAQKSNIESNYDAKTRSIKKQAAEKEKQFNVAQALIAGTLAVIKVLYDPFLAVATGVAAALGVAKIIATPIPEFAKGGVVGAPRPTWRDRVRAFARGGSINPVAGVANAGQRHSGGGIRMVDGATGEHLGEWERGEPYMILSRDTYANNKHLVDDLLDTSLYRGGAPVRPRGGHYAQGGTPGGPAPAPIAAGAGNDEQLQVARETRDAIRALPSRLRIAWQDDDTAYVEARLDERQDVRDGSGIR